jgi:serine/threonine-protein kinase
MPYITGETLKERLAREGPLAPAEVTRLVGELGSALDYAHRQGIIHRDIKPANILLHEGSALLADFGIARVASGSEDDRLTETGLSIGTPQYMSPEQASGEREIGPASDQYSLGVVAYEVLAGRLPFSGASLQAILAQLLTTPPAPLTEVRPGLPAALNSVVVRALEKEPGRRFADCGAFAAAFERGSRAQAGPLRAPAAQRHHLGRAALIGTVIALAGVGAWYLSRRAVAPAAPPRRLAVLPFANLSGDSSRDVFGRGLAVEITDELHRLDLPVVGATAALAASGRFRQGTEVDVLAAGRSLGADAVLDGSILPAGVAVELTDVRSQAVIWSEQYGLHGNLFAIQDSIARRVAGALRLTLSPRQLASARAAGGDDPEAHDLVLRGKGIILQREPAQMDQAVRLLTAAVKQDSSYADAWAALAEAYNLKAVFSDVQPAAYFRRANEAASRALALDRNSVTAHRALAFLGIMWTHDWPAAEREFRSALALDSLAPDTWLFHAWYFTSMNQADSALAAVRRARSLDTLTQVYVMRLADLLWALGRDAEAKAELNRYLQYDSSNAWVHMTLASTLAGEEHCDDARALLLRIPNLQQLDPYYLYRLRVWGPCGSVDSIRAFLRDRSGRISHGEFVSGYLAAVASSYLHDDAGMYRWLEYAVKTGDWLQLWLNFTPEFRRFHDEPRFQAILREAGMPAS